jgi:hypothetical protein
MNISPGVRKSLVDMYPYPRESERPAKVNGSVLQTETLVSQ